MLRQKLQNRQPSALQGLGLVVLVALALLAGSAFFSRLGARIGAAASVGFLLYGCAVAWFLLDWYAMGFLYTADADRLRVCRTYGKRERFVADVWLNQVSAWGAPEEMKARFPGARVCRATRAQCPFEPLALAYREDGRTAVIVLQPDEAMRRHLIGAVKGKRA